MNNFRSGFITVIGLPNAGKSSLVNALVKESVSIVTPKPQTTRKRTLGIITQPHTYQMIFVDTPGVIESDHGLNTFLKQELNQSLKDVDVLLAAIAPWEFESTEVPWSVKIALKSEKPVIFVATQADKTDSSEIQKRKEKWESWIAEFKQLPTLFFTSALTKEGLEALKDQIYSFLPEGPVYYDPELYTTQSLREISSEVVRKYCFEELFQEIPYGLAVAIRTFEEKKHIYNIEADIVIAKENHRGMIIGQGGQKLKNIGMQARQELEKTFDQKIFLKLHVVVKPHWLKDKQWLEELGYGAKTT